MKKEYKKNVMISLDPRPFEVVKLWLGPKGLTFSGFVNMVVTQLANAIEGEPYLGEKSVEELTLKEFGDFMNYWLKALQE